MRLMSGWWWALAVLLSAMAMAGMADWRWWLAALAVICVLMPGLAMLAFYHYALSPEAVRAIMPQRAVIADGVMMVIYYPLDYTSPHPGGWVPEPRTIAPADVKHCYDQGQYTAIELKDGEVIEVPLHAQPRDMNLTVFFNHRPA